MGMSNPVDYLREGVSAWRRGVGMARPSVGPELGMFEE